MALVAAAAGTLNFGAARSRLNISRALNAEDVTDIVAV